MVEQLDLSDFYAPIDSFPDGPGRPGSDPRVLLALWVYATTQGVGSSRALDPLSREHDAYRWLRGDRVSPPPPAQRQSGRNHAWSHFDAADVISMPDKWEYPWFAAWDLAFHCVAFALIDADFAKRQLLLLTREWYMHPNGQLPAYE